MKAASSSKRRQLDTQMLVFSKGGKFSHKKVADLIEYLSAGDLLIVNRSATMPSRFLGTIEGSNRPIEIRLAAFQGPDPSDLSRWLAISFSPSSWRVPTEELDPPEILFAGDRIRFSETLSARVLRIVHDRILLLDFESNDLSGQLFSQGRPIQYSYLEHPLENWDQQTIFAGPPISVEPPSAALSINWQLIRELKHRGVRVLPLLHGAGISSSGEKAIDRLLPLTEWFDVPNSTAMAINQARDSGNKIVALGTTVLRALESATEFGVIHGKSGLTRLKIQPGESVNSVDSLITGLHDIGSSHRSLVHAFCSENLIEQGYRAAERLGYTEHEYGDISLLDCGCAS